MIEKEFTTEEELRRKQIAESIINNPLYIEAWDKMKEGLMAEFDNCHPSDVERLVSIKMADVIMAKLKNYFSQIITTGDMAEIELSNKEDRTQH